MDRSRGDSPGITVEVPGRRRSLRIEHVVLDYNGTLAVDGKLIRGVTSRLKKLALKTNVIVVTADTFGSARGALSGLPVEIHIVRRGSEKSRFVESLGSRTVVCIGNGVNDLPMFRAAALSIAVLGVEGASGGLLRAATIIAQDINAALDLLLSPQRLIATLRT